MKVPETSRLDKTATLEEIIKKAPFYLPEWKADDRNDIGFALSVIFSVLAGTISSRINEAPGKHFLSFLEMLNFSLIPARPARVPLTFVLSERAPEDVLVEASTQVSANGPAGEKIIFETENNLLVTPSKITAVFSAIEKTDEIFDHTPAVNGETRTEFFSGKESLQKHILYIGDEELFNLSQGCIEIFFEGARKEFTDLLVSDKNAIWQYSVEITEKKDGEEKKIDWAFFGSVTSENQGQAIIRLEIKSAGDEEAGGKPVTKTKINGHESRWIKCEIIPSKINEFKNLKVTNIKVSASPPKIPVEVDPTTGTRGIYPDFLFYNDVPVEVSIVEIKPFGSKPRQSDTFYLGSAEGFSKSAYAVSLEFDLKAGRSYSTIGNPTVIDDPPQLSWEYWDGESWAGLGINDNLCAGGCQDTQRDTEEIDTYIIGIPEMPPVKPSRVNGKESCWIRVRLIGGNYGKDYDINSDGIVRTGKFCPPVIKNLKINYKSSEGKQPALVFAKNNLEFRDCLKDLKLFEEFRPFRTIKDLEISKEPRPLKTLSDSFPSLYFGFDRALSEGPISLYIDIEEGFEYPETFLPEVKWQYLAESEISGKESQGSWKLLEALDETAGFTKKGMLQFVVPDKMLAFSFFGSGEQYWIRALVTGDFFENFPETGSKTTTIDETTPGVEPCKKVFEILNIDFQPEAARKLPPKVPGLYFNSTWSLQVSTTYDEIIGSSSREPDQEFTFIHKPVLYEEIWVDEYGSIPEDERKSLRKDFVQVETSSEGSLKKIWVRWNRVDDFFGSSGTDRHYTVDRTAGKIRFGNAEKGRIPPGGSDNIKATYRSGGGIAGNLKAPDISKLLRATAFVDKVYNPVSSGGGDDPEQTDSLLERAPVTLKHRNRATAAEDYEWLVKEASGEVARVKVLPNFNSEGGFSTGWVTVVIVPAGTGIKPLPSSELKRNVKRYLEARCSPVLFLRVIPPLYVRVDVLAEIRTQNIDAIPVIEKTARERISDFLHPLTGYAEGKGWNFGDAPCLSDIYSILEGIVAVDYVVNVVIVYYEGSKVLTLTDTSVIKLPEYALPYSGEHSIAVKWMNGNKEG